MVYSFPCPNALCSGCTRASIGSILSCCSFICYPHACWRFIGNNLIPYLSLLTPSFISSLPFSTEGASLQMPIFQFTPKYRSFSCSHSYLPRFLAPVTIARPLSVPMSNSPIFVRVYCMPLAPPDPSLSYSFSLPICGDACVIPIHPPFTFRSDNYRKLVVGLHRRPFGRGALGHIVGLSWSNNVPTQRYHLHSFASHTRGEPVGRLRVYSLP